jgi:hypothetical protein
MRTTTDNSIDKEINKNIVIDAAKSIEKIARLMLKENIDIKFIASVTGLSTDDILKIQNKS